MKTQCSYTYSVLRYVHDVTSGEFVMVATDDNSHPEPILWKPDLLKEAKAETVAVAKPKRRKAE